MAIEMEIHHFENVRYENVDIKKSSGATYTPIILADFVASQMLEFHDFGLKEISIFDPAVGDGELLLSLLNKIGEKNLKIKIYGLDTNITAIETAKSRISTLFPEIETRLIVGDFLQFINHKFNQNSRSLFDIKDDKMNIYNSFPNCFDLVIANPPYVRTQILGKEYSHQISEQFGLDGKVDLAYAFILGILKVLKPASTLGLIVSNRFMSVKAGNSIRESMRKSLDLKHIYDLGDTKIFDAAVLPAVIIANGKNDNNSKENHIPFTTIYSTSKEIEYYSLNPISALHESGIVSIEDGRTFEVRQGVLKEDSTLTDIWKLSNEDSLNWFSIVESFTWDYFNRIGKIRVGVKTCADSIFIGKGWELLPDEERPELLKPLITHHIASRYKAKDREFSFKILYPHEVVNGKKRTINLSCYPKAKKYLEKHKEQLESRSYVIEAGREWYEIWVPQDPSAWSKPKLVFRDISMEPTFWIDLSGAVVNGDCYWLTCRSPEDIDLLWLAVAVGNSSFIEAYYDKQFGNKLLAGRRRFITQYVEKFPLPDPEKETSKNIIEKSKIIYKCENIAEKKILENELDNLVWEAFGLSIKKV